MHKYAKPPLITSSYNISSLQVDSMLKSGSRPFSWNKAYNNGIALDVTVEVPPIVVNEVIIINKVYLDFVKQPFSYIELTSTTAHIKTLVIKYIPEGWIYVFVNGVHNVIISPLTDSELYNSNNNHTLPGGSMSIVHIRPSVTSILNSTKKRYNNTNYSKVDNTVKAVTSIQLS